MQFQLNLYAHCSAFLLDEDLTLAAIDMDETDEKYASLVEARVQWMRFCRENATTIADSKPVMITVSSAIYSYLLRQVSVYQESLSGPNPSAGSSQRECSDGDDVYYRFGGGALYFERKGTCISHTVAFTRSRHFAQISSKR